MDDVDKMMELASSWAQFNDGEISVLMDIGFNKLERSYDKAAPAIAGKCVLTSSQIFEESKKGPVFFQRMMKRQEKEGKRRGSGKE